MEPIVMPPNARRFSGPQLLQIAMPMGGIGAGCVCLNGHGGIQDWSIRNKPSLSALPDGHRPTDGAYALLHIKGSKPITRLVEGPLPVEKIYDQGLQGQGYRKGGHEGLPRFAHCAFEGSYPFGQVLLSDSKVPLRVSITGFNPFIPLDDRSSGLPCAILEYRLENPTQSTVDFDFTFAVNHLAQGEGKWKGTRNARVDGYGTHFTNTDAPTGEHFGSAFLGVIGHKPKIKAMWFRGGWFDALSIVWREVTAEQFSENDGSQTGELDGGNGGAIQLSGKLKAGESVIYPIVLAWHFPNVYYQHGQPKTDCDPASGCCEPEKPGPKWRPYFAGQWKDAADVAQFVKSSYDTLRSRTIAFRDAIYGSSYPAEVIDAIASNLAILKSPTVLRQENGNIWGWEGCFAQAGCCTGSCTHVWNYAQAMPHLFPHLERTLREQELARSMDEQGHIFFRAALPDGPTRHDHHAAADGQLGGIMKVFRDWQISGDRRWLEKLYPLVKRSIDYCIRQWDPERKGALFEPHHNTYDIEFWGPDGMCTSIYIGALCAMSLMSRELGHAEDAKEYEALAKRGAEYMDVNLFNGEYYYQKVMWRELRDQSFARQIESKDETYKELLDLLRAEGPKYQYGTGCLSDGVIGAWMADFYGIPTPITRGNLRKTLGSIFKHNFRTDLSEQECTQRPGYAMGHEPGLLLCSWPRGGKPSLPFVYSDEVWTGIEYQVAAHLLNEGLVEEGLTIVRGVRARYEGHVRNPFNEYECGNYYARAMASYALLQAMSGFRYSATTRTLHLSPRVKDRPFRTFFSTQGAWGMIELSGKNISIRVIEGELHVDTLILDNIQLDWKASIRAGQTLMRDTGVSPVPGA